MVSWDVPFHRVRFVLDSLSAADGDCSVREMTFAPPRGNTRGSRAFNLAWLWPSNGCGLQFGLWNAHALIAEDGQDRDDDCDGSSAMWAVQVD